MNEKWTPGPWFEGSKGIIGPRIESDDQSNGFLGAVCEVYGEKETFDAHLISAAPDLYEALKEYLGDWGENDTMDHIPGVKKARFALAKARGES